MSTANWIFLAVIAIGFLARNIGKISPPARTAAPGQPGAAAPLPPPGYAAAPMPQPPPPPAPAMLAAPPPPPRPLPRAPTPWLTASIAAPAAPLPAASTRAFLRDAFANPAQARHAVILSEVLGPPRALR